jgi:hypothetical protein
MPPIEYRLFDTSKDEPIETPLDDKGLVDLDALITVVKETVEPSYKWISRLNDVHHLQWYKSLYHEHENPDLAIEFRELATRKAYVPRVFHNWTHRITLPPPMPTEEVMRYSIDAQKVATSLVKTTSEAVRLSRRKMIADKILEIRLEQAFENYNIYLNNAREVPIEFSLLKIEELEVKSVKEMLDINKILGRMALDQIPLREKISA